MPAADFKLSSLCYGHRGRLIRSLRGKFDPNKMDTVIQLGEMPCRCWVVLDGNNRIAMNLHPRVSRNARVMNPSCVTPPVVRSPM
jgi:hypothetical protein